jgi:hypothetical protein
MVYTNSVCSIWFMGIVIGIFAVFGGVGMGISSPFKSYNVFAALSHAIEGSVSGAVATFSLKYKRFNQ